jgi:hypothetical protein
MWWCCCFRRKKRPHVLISTYKEPNDFVPPIPEKCLLLENIQDTPCTIEIINNTTISDVYFKDLLSISIVNCPKITKLPCFSHFVNLETLKVQHCDIRVFDLFIPNCLRNLDISYCGLQEFRPQNIPQNLAELNLSFNKLKLIPRCLEHLPSATRINLANNDFWFNMYSNISPAMISPEAIEELILAYKLNLIGTSKILYAIDILHEKNYPDVARALERITCQQFEVRKTEVKSTADNAQNVHLTSVQNSMANAIKFLYSYNSHYKFNQNHIKSILQFPDDKWDQIKLLCDSTNKHSIYHMTYFQVLTKVLQVIHESPYKDTMLEVLRDEIIDGLDTCFTGQITRMVNSLNGFVKQIKVGIDHKEELSNTIIAIRKKYSMIYNDIEQYTTETIPIVWQLLEDSCVPEHEHAAWLEYV